MSHTLSHLSHALSQSSYSKKLQLKQWLFWLNGHLPAGAGGGGVEVRIFWQLDLMLPDRNPPPPAPSLPTVRVWPPPKVNNDAPSLRKRSVCPISPILHSVRVVMTVVPSPWRTAIVSTTVLTSFLSIAFSVHCTPLFWLSLQSFLRSSSTLGCLRAWQFPLHSWYQNQLILTNPPPPYHERDIFWCVVLFRA